MFMRWAYRHVAARTAAYNEPPLIDATSRASKPDPLLVRASARPSMTRLLGGTVADPTV
jgi:hypothetical protein